jgi:hypothetical protein
MARTFLKNTALLFLVYQAQRRMQKPQGFAQAVMQVALVGNVNVSGTVNK